MPDVSECYRLLDLAPGASADEVRDSWRDLVQVWHPDRFSSGRLREKAEERLKLINLAYETLKNGGSPNSLPAARPSSDVDPGLRPDIFDALAEGVEAWNLFRKKWSDVRPSLAGRDLSGRPFEGIDFRECNLAAANFSRADLYKANLSYARANGACFNGADLNRAIAHEIELEEADLTDANLASADLRGARLKRANLTGASLACARLEGADLSKTRGLVPEQLQLADIDAETKLPAGLY